MSKCRKQVNPLKAGLGDCNNRLLHQVSCESFEAANTHRQSDEQDTASASKESKLPHTHRQLDEQDTARASKELKLHTHTQAMRWNYRKNK